MRAWFFRNRSYTPIPLIVLALILANPSAWSYGVGLVIMIGGEAIRLWALRYAGGATRTTARVGGDTLVTAGPYAHVRNPLYVGNFFIGLGLFAMAWPGIPWLLLVYLGFFALQYGLIVSAEEDYLQQRFGAMYQSYRAQVPRWRPRLTAFQTSKVRPAPWPKTLRTDRSTLATMATLAALILLRQALRHGG